MSRPSDQARTPSDLAPYQSFPYMTYLESRSESQGKYKRHTQYSHAKLAVGYTDGGRIYEWQDGWKLVEEVRNGNLINLRRPAKHD